MLIGITFSTQALHLCSKLNVKTLGVAVRTFGTFAGKIIGLIHANGGVVPVLQVGGQRVLLFWLQLITAWRTKPTVKTDFLVASVVSTEDSKADSSPSLVIPSMCELEGCYEILSMKIILIHFFLK